jgi:hypothetical protein
MKGTFMKFKVILICLIFCFAALPAHAVKIDAESFDFASSFHIGAVMGPGLGLNFGLDAGIPMGDFELGLEFEQIITDYDYEVSINARRFGLITRYHIIEDLFSAAIHFGSAEFSTSQDVFVSDVFGGDETLITGGKINTASYLAASLEWMLGDLILSPKVCLNYVGGGAVLQLDLNIGTRF